jgi:hypothetical protein
LNNGDPLTPEQKAARAKKLEENYKKAMAINEDGGNHTGEI